MGSRSADATARLLAVLAHISGHGIVPRPTSEGFTDG